MCKALLPHVNESLVKRKPLYDPVKDLEPIASVVSYFPVYRRASCTACSRRVGKVGKVVYACHGPITKRQPRRGLERRDGERSKRRRTERTTSRSPRKGQPAAGSVRCGGQEVHQDREGARLRHVR